MKYSDEDIKKAMMEQRELPGELEFFEGNLLRVKNSSRNGWWRFHEHYDRNGYCDNPSRGY